MYNKSDTPPSVYTANNIHSVDNALAAAMKNLPITHSKAVGSSAPRQRPPLTYLVQQLNLPNSVFVLIFFFFSFLTSLKNVCPVTASHVGGEAYFDWSKLEGVRGYSPISCRRLRMGGDKEAAVVDVKVRKGGIWSCVTGEGGAAILSHDTKPPTELRLLRFLFTRVIALDEKETSFFRFIFKKKQ